MGRRNRDKKSLTLKEVSAVRQLLKCEADYPDERLPARPARASLKPGEPGSWAEAMKQWTDKQKGQGGT